MSTIQLSVGIPANGPATVVIGSAPPLTEQQLTDVLIAAGHPQPDVAVKFLSQGTSRPTIPRRTAQDFINEASLRQKTDQLAVVTSALRRRLSPQQLAVLDFAGDSWFGSSAVAEWLEISQQGAANVITKLLDLGLLVRREMGHPDARVRLYRSALAEETIEEALSVAPEETKEAGEAT